MMVNLAVIPARGGSKRLPRKNVMVLAGRPMLAYTIEAAISSGLFDLVVVSTDDREIAEIAEMHGAAVPFLRTDALADDYTPVSEVTLDALLRLEADGHSFDYVSQLMANCPLRNADDVVHSWEQFQPSGFESQVSVTSYGWLNPWWALQREETGAARPVFEEMLKQRSQDLPALYCPTGAVWWTSSDSLKRERTFHIAQRSLYELPWYRAIDIDDLADLQLAEVLMESGGIKRRDREQR